MGSAGNQERLERAAVAPSVCEQSCTDTELLPCGKHLTDVCWDCRWLFKALKSLMKHVAVTVLARHLPTSASLSKVLFIIWCSRCAPKSVRWSLLMKTSEGQHRLLSVHALLQERCCLWLMSHSLPHSRVEVRNLCGTRSVPGCTSAMALAVLCLEPVLIFRKCFIQSMLRPNWCAALKAF